MVILITGATGFVMSALARHLAEHGHHVIAADLKPLCQEGAVPLRQSYGPRCSPTPIFTPKAILRVQLDRNVPPPSDWYRWRRANSVRVGALDLMARSGAGRSGSAAGQEAESCFVHTSYGHCIRMG